MARERLSQVQKALLLTADEYRREYKTNIIRYRRLLKQLAVKAERIHERSKCMLPKYLVTVSRSVRNMEEKGLVELHFSYRFMDRTFYTYNLRSITLTARGKQALERVRQEGGWENIGWLEKCLREGEERRKKIAEFNQKLARLGINLP